MKKNFLKELILPAFWLFFFIVSSKNNNKTEDFKQPDNSELKTGNMTNQEYAGRNKESKSTKALYLTKF